MTMNQKSRWTARFRFDLGWAPATPGKIVKALSVIVGDVTKINVMAAFEEYHQNLTVSAGVDTVIRKEA